MAETLDLLAGTGVDLLADPNKPGPFKRGVAVGVANLKSIGGGLVQAAGHATGYGALEARGAAIVQAANEASAPLNMDTSAVTAGFEEGILPGLGAAADYAKFQVGAQLPMLATSLAGGVGGVVAGNILKQGGAAAARAAAARGLTEEAAVNIARGVTARNATAGAFGASYGLEAGQIFPEAVETGVANPLLRTMIGAAPAAALDTIVPILGARYLGLIGKGGGLSEVRKAGFGAVAKGAAAAAGVGGLAELSTEAIQTVIERAAAGQSLTDPEAMQEVFEAGIAGGTVGLLFGGLAGGVRTKMRPTASAPVQIPPVSTNREQPPAVNTPSVVVPPPAASPPLSIPEQELALHGELTARHATISQEVATITASRTAAQTEFDTATARLAALKDELAMPEGERRAKREILVERKAAQKQVTTLKGSLDDLGGKLFKANELIGNLTPQIDNLTGRIAARNAPQNELVPTGERGVVQPDGTVVPVPPVEPAPLDTQVAVAKVQRSLGIPPTDPLVATALRREDAVTAETGSRRAAALVKVQERGRGASKQVATIMTSAQQKSIVTHVMPVVERISQAMAEAKETDPGKRITFAKDMAADIRAAVEKSAQLSTLDGAQVDVLTSVVAALKGYGVKEDATQIAAEVMAAMENARTVYSRGASEAPAVGHFYSLSGGRYGRVTRVDANGGVLLQRVDKEGSPYIRSGETADGAATAQHHFISASVADLGAQKELDRHYGGLVPYGTAKNPAPDESNAALTQPEFDALPPDGKEQVVDQYNTIMAGKGQALVAEVHRITGINDPELTVTTFQAQPGSPIGSFTRDDYKSIIALALNAADGFSLAAHEGYHYLERMKMTAAERAIVARELRPGKPLYERLVAHAQKYDRENQTKITDEITAIPAEARAYAFQFYRSGALQIEGAIQRVWDKVVAMLRQLAAFITGQGFTSVEDVFTAIDRGAFAQRQRNTSELGSEFSSRGSDQTSTPEFKRWFGDSKVVDAQGKPLVVYRALDKEYYDPINRTRVQFWTPDSTAANQYAGNRAYGSNIVPAYLAIKNLFDLTTDVGAKKLAKLSGQRWTVHNPYWELIEQHGDIREVLAPLGYDGIKMADGEGGVDHNTYVTFEAAQVKSAIGNIGTFDPTNPDIRYSKGSVRATPGVDMVRMAKLLGPQLYGNMADIGPVTIKEMFQNSFDALKDAIKLGERTEGSIAIELDDATRTITLRDDGLGMTPGVINKAFLTLAGTQKVSDRASGGLGIAKMLFLFGNKALRLRTVRNGVESVLETSGAELMESFSDPTKAPQIITNETSDPNGTTIAVVVPETYRDEDTDTDKEVAFPSAYSAKHQLLESPLFEPIRVTINGDSVAIGKDFPADAYTVLTVAKFAWGKVRVLVADTTYPPYENVSVLSNGLFQFGDKITKDPSKAFSSAAPYKFFFNLEPDVKADAPNYPISLNRKGYAQSAQSDFKVLTQYINVLYANKQDEAGAASFGTLVQVAPNGTQPSSIDLSVPPAKRGTTISINKGDKVEVRDGRLYVNSREMPELTKEALKEMKRDPAQFRVDQALLDPEKIIIHDNVLLGGNPYLDEAVKELGAGEVSGYLRGVGGVFLAVRDAAARAGGSKYSNVMEVPVGVSLDVKYYGVNTSIPFKAMMVNPALVRDANPDTAAVRMVSTMIHEVAHHTEKNHSETGFIPELQRLGVVLAVSGDTQRITEALQKVLEKYSNVLDYFIRMQKDGSLTNRGIRLEGDHDAAASEGVSGGATGAGRTGGDDSDLPGVRRAVATGDQDRLAGQDRGRASQADTGRLYSRGAVDTGPSGLGPLYNDLSPEQRQAYDRATRKALKDQERRKAAGELGPQQVFDNTARMMESAMEHGDKITAEAAKRVVGNIALEGVGGLSRWWQRNIATPNFIAAFSNGYKNVFRVLNTYVRYRNELVERLMIQRIPEWYTATAEDQHTTFDALNKRNLEGYTRDSIQLRDLTAQLTPQQRTMFLSATRMFEDFLRKEFAADQVFWQKVYVTPGLYDTKVAERALQVDTMIDKGYMPLRRYGDHTVHVYMDATDKDGKPYKQSAALQFLLNERGALNVAQIYRDEIARTGSGLKVEVGTHYKAARDTTISAQQFLDTARRNGVPLTALEQERLVIALTTAESLTRNRMLHREGMPGYSKDGMRVINEFGMHMAGKLAYSRFAVAIDAASDGRAVESDVINGEAQIRIDDVRMDAQGTPEPADEYKARDLWRIEGPLSGFHRNLSDELTDYVLVPDHTGGWSRKLRGAAMMYFIGGSISGAMVNTMSVPMMVVPQLSIHTDYTNALAASMSAWKQTWQHQAILRDITRMRDIDNNPMPEIDRVPGLRSALMEASQYTQDTELHAVMSISQGQLFSQNQTVQRAMKTWMSPFRVSEQTNRITAFIAAYKIASTDDTFRRADGSVGRLQGPALFKFARDMVDATQNNYNETNRPGAMRSPIFAIFLMFKSFPLFMTEAAVLMYKANPRAAVFMLLGLTAMTGVEGLPFAGLLQDLIDTIAQRIFGSPFNTRRAMRNVIKSASEAFVGYDASELVLRGAINAVAGVSASSRIGAGDFVPGSRLGTADADQGRILEQMLGAPYAMVKDAGESIGGFTAALATGDWKKAVDAMRAGGPVAVRNLIKGMEQLSDGYASDSKGRKLVDVSGVDGVLQLTGLASAQLAKAYEYENINRATKAFHTQVSSDMQHSLVKALRAGDTEKVQEIQDLRNAWNEANPSMQIMPNAAAVRREMALAGLPMDRRSVLLWSRRIRGANVFSEQSGEQD